MLICTPGPGIGQLRCLQLGHLRGEDRGRRRPQRGRRRRQEPQRGRQGGRRGQVLLAPRHALLREFNTKQLLDTASNFNLCLSKNMYVLMLFRCSAIQSLTQQTLE